MKKPFFPEEIRSLAKEELEKIDFIDFAILFGSYAKGFITPLSDLDPVFLQTGHCHY